MASRMDTAGNRKIESDYKKSQATERRRSIWKGIKRDRFLYLLALPGIVFFILFKYVPMWGILISFQDYSPYQGMWASPWIGFEHYIRFFSNPDFLILFRNTMAINLLSLIFFFPLPIMLSVMMNELRGNKFRKTIQSIVYLPHFSVLGHYRRYYVSSSVYRRRHRQSASGGSRSEQDRLFDQSQLLLGSVDGPVDMERCRLGYGIVPCRDGRDRSAVERSSEDRRSGTLAADLAYYSAGHPFGRNHSSYSADWTYYGRRLRASLPDDERRRIRGRRCIRYLCV